MKLLTTFVSEFKTILQLSLRENSRKYQSMEEINGKSKLIDNKFPEYVESHGNDPADYLNVRRQSFSGSKPGKRLEE